MITKKARPGRHKKSVNKNTNDKNTEELLLLEDEKLLLGEVKQKNKGTIMSLLNKRKVSKYELDEVFVGDEEDYEDL